jgi:hypothetical protein
MKELFYTARSIETRSFRFTAEGHPVVLSASFWIIEMGYHVDYYAFISVENHINLN